MNPNQKKIGHIVLNYFWGKSPLCTICSSKIKWCGEKSEGEALKAPPPSPDCIGLRTGIHIFQKSNRIIIIAITVYDR